MHTHLHTRRKSAYQHLSMRTYMCTQIIMKFLLVVPYCLKSLFLEFTSFPCGKFCKMILTTDVSLILISTFLHLWSSKAFRYRKLLKTSQTEQGHTRVPSSPSSNWTQSIQESCTWSPLLKFLAQRSLVSKNFRLTNLGRKKLWVTDFEKLTMKKQFGSENILDPKKFQTWLDLSHLDLI